MMDGHSVHHGEVPEGIRGLTTMDRPDYADVFTVAKSGTTDGSPEEWARAGVEDAAGTAGQILWRRVLGLRLEDRRDRVGGWKVGDRGENWIRLEASSWFMTAHIVVRIEEDRVSVATIIRYDRLLAALVWPPVAAAHRRAMPGLLRHAARSRATSTSYRDSREGIRV